MTNSFFRNNTADQDKKLAAERQTVEGLEVLIQRVTGSSHPQALRLDDAGGGIMYIGVAAPGTAEGTAAWRIKEILTTGADVAILWPDGSSEYAFSWTARAGLNYI